MSFWQSLARMLDPASGRGDEPFQLGETSDIPSSMEDGAARLMADAQLRAEGIMTHIENLLEAQGGGKKALEKAGDLSTSLKENVQRLKATFRMPENMDLIVRELTVATQPPTPAVACFMEGLADKTIINRDILEPLMLLSHLDHHLNETGENGTTAFSLQTVIKRLLPGHQVSEKPDMAAIADSLLAGDSVLLFEGMSVALAVETKGFPVRSVSQPVTEKVIHGPHDAFVEAFRINVSLVRRRLKDPRVVTKVLTVGQVSNTYVAVMWIDGIASPKLVAEVRRRIEAIDVDIVNGAGILEQYIEDNPSSLLPGILSTERPDRVAAYLSEGHVAIFVDNSPQGMICPITFWSLLQTSEDYYLRYPFASFLRYVRLAALAIALIVPALYISVVNYHPEMIPTELMLFVASSRESVPLPAVAELLVLDLAFELIREAGTRIPSVIGPTMGLVASLILGQAAVEAKIVSPLLIIVVAITGLASFAIPNYLTSFGIRSLRFLLLGAATVLGFYGVAALVFILVVHLAGMQSFGVPFLAPIAPSRRGTFSDVFGRAPLFEMELRPGYVHPVDRRRQEERVRTWDPNAATSREQGG